MKKISQIPIEKIMFLKGDINYTIFHLKDGEKFISSTTLKKHSSEAYLSSFLRIHKSYLLNPDFIKKVENNGKSASILMLDGQKLVVSRRKMSLLENINQ